MMFFQKVYILVQLITNTRPYTRDCLVLPSVTMFARDMFPLARGDQRP